MVDQNSASWNRVVGCLRQIEALHERLDGRAALAESDGRLVDLTGITGDLLNAVRRAPNCTTATFGGCSNT